LAPEGRSRHPAAAAAAAERILRLEVEAVVVEAVVV